MFFLCRLYGIGAYSLIAHNAVIMFTRWASSMIPQRIAQWGDSQPCTIGEATGHRIYT